MMSPSQRISMRVLGCPPRLKEKTPQMSWRLRCRFEGHDTHEEIGRSGGETGWCEGQSHCVTRDACSAR